MQAQPSAKSSFCLGTDRTAISQSLLNPFLLAAFFFQALLRTTCRTETEKRAFFIHISFSLLCVYIFWRHIFTQNFVKTDKSAFLATSGVSSSKTYSIYNPVGMSPCRQPSKRVFVCVYLQVFFVLCWNIVQASTHYEYCVQPKHMMSIYLGPSCFTMFHKPGFNRSVKLIKVDQAFLSSWNDCKYKMRIRKSLLSKAVFHEDIFTWKLLLAKFDLKLQLHIINFLFVF